MKTTRMKISKRDGTSSKYNKVMETFCSPNRINSCHGNIIREYGSTLYVGMARKKNGRPYISIASDELKSLVIYTNKFLYTHACSYLVFL